VHFSEKDWGGGDTSLRKRLLMLCAAQRSSCCVMLGFLWQARRRRTRYVHCSTVGRKSVFGLSRIQYLGILVGGPVTFLRFVARSLNSETRLLTSCPSVRPRATVRLTLGGFS